MFFKEENARTKFHLLPTEVQSQLAELEELLAKYSLFVEVSLTPDLELFIRITHKL